MANLLFLIALIVAAVVDANTLNRVASGHVDANESVLYTDESFPREALIKMVQSHLLKQLNLSADSLDAGLIPQVPDDLVRIVMNGEDKEGKVQKVVLRPRNNIFSCLESGEQNCSRFEFEVDSEWDTVESLRVWFRKKHRTSPLEITVSFNGISNVLQYDENDLDVIVEFGRIGFDIMKPSIGEARGSVNCSIEAKGASVYEDDEDSPFLVVTKNLDFTSSRQRRSNGRTQRAPCSCCVVDRFVNVTELKMDHIIIYPAVMNIKACRGRCHIDQGAFNMSYGSIMYNFAKHNSSISDYLDEFWVPRCYPSKMESMGMFYVDNPKNKIVQSNVAAMVVESCSCMSYTCYSHR